MDGEVDRCLRVRGRRWAAAPSDCRATAQHRVPITAKPPAQPSPHSQSACLAAENATTTRPGPQAMTRDRPHERRHTWRAPRTHRQASAAGGAGTGYQSGLSAVFARPSPADSRPQTALRSPLVTERPAYRGSCLPPLPSAPPAAVPRPSRPPRRQRPSAPLPRLLLLPKARRRVAAGASQAVPPTL